MLVLNSSPQEPAVQIYWRLFDKCLHLDKTLKFIDICQNIDRSCNDKWLTSVNMIFQKVQIVRKSLEIKIKKNFFLTFVKILLTEVALTNGRYFPIHLLVVEPTEFWVRLSPFSRYRYLIWPLMSASVNKILQLF